MKKCDHIGNETCNVPEGVWFHSGVSWGPKLAQGRIPQYGFMLPEYV